MVKAWEAESIAIQQQKAKKLRRQVWRRRVYGCAGICVLAYGGLLGWWLDYSGELDRISEASHRRLEQMALASGMTVRAVRVEGQQLLSPQSIVAQAAIDPKQLIMAIDLSEIKTRLESHPQIAQAQVTRTLPDRIEIQVSERQPAALWQHDARQIWLDKEGVQLDASQLTAAQKARHFPVITGQGADVALANFWQILEAAPELKDKVVAAQWIGGRRWNLVFEGGLKLLLPSHDPQKAFATFAQWQLEHGLFDKAIAQLDLRVGGMAYVRYQQEAPVAPNSAGNLLTVSAAGAI